MRGFYIIGKSASGKDSVYRRVLEDLRDQIRPIVLHTTRPMRDGERNGVEYFF